MDACNALLVMHASMLVTFVKFTSISGDLISKYDASVAFCPLFDHSFLVSEKPFVSQLSVSLLRSYWSIWKQ